MIVVQTTLKQEGLLGRHQSRLTASVHSHDNLTSQTTSQQQCKSVGFYTTDAAKYYNVR